MRRWKAPLIALTVVAALLVVPAGVALAKSAKVVPAKHVSAVHAKTPAKPAAKKVSPKAHAAKKPAKATSKAARKHAN